MSGKKREKKAKKPMNKPTIFFLMVFIGFSSGVILGLGLNQIVVNKTIVKVEN